MQLELCRNEVSKTKILCIILSTVKLVQFLSFAVAARLAFSSTRSPSSTVTLSTLEIVEEEYTVVDTLYILTAERKNGICVFQEWCVTAQNAVLGGPVHSCSHP